MLSKDTPNEPRVVSLQLCPGHRLPMQFETEIVAIADLGLQGDRHAKPNGRRQVLLMDQAILTLLKLEPGIIRENITVTGLPIHEMDEGQLLYIGPEVILELTGLCVPCKRMDEIQMGLAAALTGKRGVLARVVRGGRIALSDHIRLHPTNASHP